MIPLLGIFLGERVEAIKSSPHGRCDRYSTDVLDGTVPQQRRCWHHCTISLSASSSDGTGSAGQRVESRCVSQCGPYGNISHKRAEMTFCDAGTEV